jgi:hypothetical protein
MLMKIYFYLFFIILLLSFLDLQAQDYLFNPKYAHLPQKNHEEMLKANWMIRPAVLLGNDMTCGGIFVPQFTLVRRNFNDFSVQPAFTITKVYYGDCDGYTDENFAALIGMYANIQFFNYLHLRGILNLGYETKSSFVGESMLGIGLNIWRLESTLYLGYVTYYNDTYIAAKLGLGYIFSNTRSFNPKGKN